MTIQLAKGLVAMFLCLGLTACGLKGPLYMPPPEQPTAQPSAQPTPAEKPASGATQQ
ncbi:lipoprotein [Aeromonas sp. RU39B]|uniref:LPS translocon maturation chaperone LptM n=1 Tax=Aeromonas sp. RU39B TaxID=1907416 RepID=UPI000971303D|nr:lipoprotein [Aeromonas sp. RU39B]